MLLPCIFTGYEHSRKAVAEYSSTPTSPVEAKVYKHFLFQTLHFILSSFKKKK